MQQIGDPLIADLRPLGWCGRFFYFLSSYAAVRSRARRFNPSLAHPSSAIGAVPRSPRVATEQITRSFAPHIAATQ